MGLCYDDLFRVAGLLFDGSQWPVLVFWVWRNVTGAGGVAVRDSALVAVFWGRA